MEHSFNGLAAGTLLLTAWLVSVLLTGVARAYALRRALLDIPNERSSHSVPTPRGGGLAIAITLAVAVAVLGLFGSLPREVARALLGGGALVAGIGWWDDHRHVAPRWRVLVHVLAAAWAVYCLGGLSKLMLGSGAWNLGWFGSLLAAIAIVWLINLYNFMDGIDGLAGVEAVTAGLSGAALLWWVGSPGLALAAASVAMSCAGFLWWNWPPAKIFMGDVGSGLLGYCFAVLALAGEKTGQLPALIWAVLLAIFVTDATFTLISRVSRGEQWYTAHRCHAYQRSVQLGFSHRRVTVAVGCINVLVLFPAAVLALTHPAILPWCVGAAAAGGWALWKTVQHKYRNTALAKN